MFNSFQIQIKFTLSKTKLAKIQNKNGLKTLLTLSDEGIQMARKCRY